MLNPKENPWLYPELVRSVEGLQLFARQALSTYLTGAHGSRRVGAEQEFSQYRSYQPGDDLRRLDWKVYARSGRLYVKEADIHTRLLVRFVLDASGSMNHFDGKWHKLDYAKALIALLALLARQQGDEFALFAASERLVHNQMAGNDKAYIHRFLHELGSLKAGDRWPDVRKMSYFPDQPNENELVLLFTDMYQEGEELFEAVKRLKRAKNEVLVFHLLGANELDLEKLPNGVALRDLETGETLQMTAEDKRKSQERIREFIQQTRDVLIKEGVTYVQVNMSEPPHEAISLYLKKRSLMQ